MSSEDAEATTNVALFPTPIVKLIAGPAYAAAAGLNLFNGPAISGRISTGAGTVNWVSMYAQSDVQRNREFYFGGKPPYEDFAKWWDFSPLKFIKNAKTPTLIHVVDGDPRVPRPQSEELHMALKKLGVPTEFMVYPGNTHGIPDPRNQLVKAVAEFNWFEKWIRGKQGWFEWKELLQTLKDEKADEKKSA